MAKVSRLSKSGIEYLDYGWNPYSGCLHWQNGVCAVGKNCWARRLTERHKEFYHNGFEPTFYTEAFLSPLSMNKPARIGVAFMGDLFGDWVDPDMDMADVAFPITIKGKTEAYQTNKSLKEIIFDIITVCPQHTFLFLTKAPHNLLKWSPFPDNCWVGVSATNAEEAYERTSYLAGSQAKVKYISFEPLLGKPDGNYGQLAQVMRSVDWVIIGAQTRPRVLPMIDWLLAIVDAADEAGVPIFLKNNLVPMFQPYEDWYNISAFWSFSEDRKQRSLRQEIPG